MTMGDQNATASQTLSQWIAKHGPVQGAPFTMDPQVDVFDEATQKTVKGPNPNPTYRYTFADGSSLEMDWYGAIKSNDEKPAKSNTPPGWTDVTPVRNADGTTTYYGKDPATGRYGQVPGLPSGASTTATTPKPTPASQLEIINDPTTGKPIKYRDPATGTVIDLPDGATATKPTIVQGTGGAIYSWDGTKLTLQQAGDAKPTEGATRRNVQNGMAITEVYRGGSWAVDPSVAPVPYDTTKPKEGDTRGNVSGGYAVQEVYRGGQWVTDPTVPPKPYDPSLANKPKDGDTRPNVKDGYNVTETYKGGEWTTTTVGGRATLQPTVAASAPADQQFNTRFDPNTSQYIQSPNANYQPTDPAQRVQQLRDQAIAKRDELNKQVLNGKDPKDAAAEFDAWWTATVEPQKQQITTAQQQAQTDATIKQNQELRAQQEAERNAFSTAQTAGTNAVQAAQAGMAYRVGPGFGGAVNQLAGAFASGKPAGNLDIGGAVTFDMPDFSQIAEQATAQALAHLSPTAAGKVGSALPGVPQGIDVNAALNQSQYRPGTTTVAPDGTITVAHPQPAPAPDPFGTYRPPQLAPPVGPPRGPLYG